MYEQKTYLAIALLVGEVRLENGRANNERENDDKRGREYVSQPASQPASQLCQPVSFVSQSALSASQSTYPEDHHGLVRALLRSRSGRIHVHSLQNMYKRKYDRTFTSPPEGGKKDGEMLHVVE